MKQITATEIIALSTEGKKVLAIDLREGYRLQQYDAGGLRVPYKELKTHEAYLKTHQDAVVVLCCMTVRNSGRVAQAAKILAGMGHKDVRELSNGIVAGWTMLWGKEIPNRTMLPKP